MRTATYDIAREYAAVLLCTVVMFFATITPAHAASPSDTMFSQVSTLVANLTRVVNSLQAEVIATMPQVLGASAVNVSTHDELMTALQNATGGETIMLAPGNYGKLSLSTMYGQPWAAYPSTVTITSADQSNFAVFDSIGFEGVTNLTFDHIKVHYDPGPNPVGWEKAVYANQSSHITFTNDDFEGVDAVSTDPAANGYPTSYALSVANSTSTTIDNNTFHTWLRGVLIGGSTNVTVTNNDVYDIRSDGMDFAQVNNVLIENNHIHDFRISATSGDHPDGIQFWTDKTTSPTTNITIRKNFISPDGMSQNIFMRNEAVDSQGGGLAMYYKNLDIEDNVINGGHLHGISVGETDGLTIRHNTLIHNPDSGTDTVTIPSINVNTADKNVVISDNIMPVDRIDKSSGFTVSNNLVTQEMFPDQPNYVGSIFADGLAGNDALPVSLMAIPGDVIDQKNVGASMTHFDTTPSSPAGYIIDTPGVGRDLLTHTFDASNVYNANGKTTASSVSWDFGDGTKGSGVTTSHTYTKSGKYRVRAIASLSGGGSATMYKHIVVTDPKIVDLSFEGNLTNNANQPGVTLSWSNPLYVAGPTGKAASFALNGSSADYVNVNGVGTLLTGIKQVSYSLDLKSTAAPAGRPLWLHVAFGNGLSSTGLYVAWWDENNTGISIPVSTTAFADGNWHHLGAIYDGIGGTTSVYLDGVKVAEQSIPKNALSYQNRPLGIGSDPWNSQFTGLIDNVKVYQGVWPELMATSTTPTTTNAPTASLSASPTSITAGDSSTLAWSSTNTTVCTGTGFTANGISGSVSVSPTQTTTYSVTCTGTSGSASDSTAVTVTNSGDTSAPTTPTNLIGTAVSDSSVALSWSASTDNVGVTDYVVYRDNAEVGTPTSITFTDTSLTASTTYSYTVAARDAAGNMSAKSSVVSVATQSIVEPPTSTFSIGDRVYTTDKVNVRSTPALSGKPGKQNIGALGTVVGGPVVADGYTWWSIDFDTGADGWVAGDFLSLDYTAPVQHGKSDHTNNGNNNQATNVSTTGLSGAPAPSAGGGTASTLSNTTGSNGNTSSGATVNTFTRSLKQGDHGTDVQELQHFLNTHGYPVTTTGDGSLNHETTYFGPATRAALIRYQNAHKDAILTPYGETTGTGHFGPLTMKEVNSELSTTPATNQGLGTITPERRTQILSQIQQILTLIQVLQAKLAALQVS